MTANDTRPLIPYLRQSRAKERTISIDEQRRDIRKWAADGGVPLAAEVVEQNVSGSKPWRERALVSDVARTDVMPGCIRRSWRRSNTASTSGAKRLEHGLDPAEGPTRVRARRPDRASQDFSPSAAVLAGARPPGEALADRGAARRRVLRVGRSVVPLKRRGV
jgi:Resolvase, N terminal domain